MRAGAHISYIEINDFPGHHDCGKDVRNVLLKFHCMPQVRPRICKKSLQLSGERIPVGLDDIDCASLAEGVDELLERLLDVLLNRLGELGAVVLRQQIADLGVGEKPEKTRSCR